MELVSSTCRLVSYLQSEITVAVMHHVVFCSYVINELIQTEKLYVDDLAQIVLVGIICHSVS